MSQRIDRTITNLIGHLEALGYELPLARNALLDRLHNIDGYSSGSDNPHVQSTSELTPTEAAASQRQHVDRLLADLDDTLNAIVLNVKNLRADCQRYVANKPETPRCTSTGRDGAIEWSDPLCMNVPSRGPLCIPCYHRERRWRLAHDLPTREEPAA